MNLSAPGKSIIVQVSRNAVACSVVSRYRDLHKFNIKKCAEVEEADGANGKQKEQMERKKQQQAEQEQQQKQEEGKEGAEAEAKA